MKKMRYIPSSCAAWTETEGRSRQASSCMTVTDAGLDDGCPWAGVDRTICAGETILIGYPADGNPPNYCYRWLPEEGLDDPYAPQPWASPQQTIVYSIFVTDNAGNLVATDEVTITVNELNASINPPKPVLCNGLPLILLASEEVEIYQYSWSTYRDIQIL